MTLPRIDAAIYNLILPSTGKTIRLRPYRVKEEKIMLLARETKDPVQVADAIEQVIRNCVLDDEFNPSRLATFDLDVLLLKLRAVSGGETIDVRYPIECADAKCEQVGEATINLNGYDLEKPPPAPKIQLSDSVTITLRYPSLKTVRQVAEVASPIERASLMLALCLDQVVEGETVMHADDYSVEELVAWVETFPNDRYMPIVQFFETIPEVKFTVEFQCKKCGKAEKVTIKSIESFFA